MFNFPGKLAERIRETERICVLTGAGVSAESGVPTFRGGGQSAVWKGMPFDQISSAQMVRENLDEVWQWFDFRRGVLAKCAPNAGHRALAEWPELFDDARLVTQNVDGLHLVAGSGDVIELHGNINWARCEDCGHKCDITGVIPHAPANCTECAGRMRPDVVLFGEMLGEGVFEAAVVAASSCEMFVIVGTSAMVYPAASLAPIARQAGAILVEINPEETLLSSSCDFALQGMAATVLPEFTRIRRESA